MKPTTATTTTWERKLGEMEQPRDGQTSEGCGGGDERSAADTRMSDDQQTTAAYSLGFSDASGSCEFASRRAEGAQIMFKW